MSIPCATRPLVMPPDPSCHLIPRATGPSCQTPHATIPLMPPVPLVPPDHPSCHRTTPRATGPPLMPPDHPTCHHTPCATRPLIHLIPRATGPSCQTPHARCHHTPRATVPLVPPEPDHPSCHRITPHATGPPHVPPAPLVPPDHPSCHRITPHATGPPHVMHRRVCINIGVTIIMSMITAVVSCSSLNHSSINVSVI